MSLRLRGALLGLVAAVAVCAAAPAVAAADSLSVTPSSTQAGSNPQITATLNFAQNGDAVKTAVLSAAPGLLANLNANPACLATSSPTPACQIGSGSITTDQPQTIPTTLYLVAPQPGTGDFAGILAVPPAGLGLPNQYTGASLRSTPNVGVNLTTTFPDTRPFGFVITKVTTTLNPTLNGQPFTRLPSSCGPATSTMTVTYQGTTPPGSGSDTFTPTGCANLPYAPKLTFAVTRDKNDNGAGIVSTITQQPTEAASKTIVLSMPKGLQPNISADLPCLNATGCKVGTAVATSPGVPSSALANGTVTLAGQGTTPTISVSFPAPFAVTITGTVSLTNNSVTFANVPDVPLSSLTLNISGPNGKKAFTTDCAPANITGTFTGQNGATETATAPIAFSGCALKPTANGSSTSGLASGHPKLKFKVTQGKGAPRVSSVAIRLPRGLSFARSAFVSHKTCTSGNKKCSTTTLIKGLAVSGAKAKSVKLTHGRLVIALKRPANVVRITISQPLASESKALQTKVKKHKTQRLTFSLRVTDAKHAATTVPVKLRAH